jgi:hypothetical protein
LGEYHLVFEELAGKISGESDVKLVGVDDVGADEEFSSHNGGTVTFNTNISEGLTKFSLLVLKLLHPKFIFRGAIKVVLRLGKFVDGLTLDLGDESGVIGVLSCSELDIVETKIDVTADLREWKV